MKVGWEGEVYRGEQGIRFGVVLCAIGAQIKYLQFRCAFPPFILSDVPRPAAGLCMQGV